MIDALVSGKVKHYVTDFPTQVIAGVKGAIVIPHLGASTEESEDNCAKMAVREIRDYLLVNHILRTVHSRDMHRNIITLTVHFVYRPRMADKSLKITVRRWR